MSNSSDKDGNTINGHGTGVLLVKEREHFLVGDDLGFVEILKNVISFHMENVKIKNRKLYRL